jgi:hypothetical protein
MFQRRRDTFEQRNGALCREQWLEPRDLRDLGARASWSRVRAGCDFHPKACLRKRDLKRQEWPRVLCMGRSQF